MLRGMAEQGTVNEKCVYAYEGISFGPSVWLTRDEEVIDVAVAAEITTVESRCSSTLNTCC